MTTTNRAPVGILAPLLLLLLLGLVDESRSSVQPQPSPQARSNRPQSLFADDDDDDDKREASPSLFTDNGDGEGSASGAGELPPFVLKRSGRQERAEFHKIEARISRLCAGLDTRFVDATRVAQKVALGMYAGATSNELDALSAESAAYMSPEHFHYGALASRIAVSNLHRRTSASFCDTIMMLHEEAVAAEEARRLTRASSHDGGGEDEASPDAEDADAEDEESGFFSRDLIELVSGPRAAEIDARIVHARDYDFDFFGFKTLERAYLLKDAAGLTAERPQYMLMRVALGMHADDLAAAFETYELMSTKAFIHASPTLFHAGLRRPQLSSCFLLTMQSDSINGIYDTLSKCASISKAAGGIGFSVSTIRATGSPIRGTKGVSNGLVPMLRVFDATARYVDQGGGKRPGAFAVYLEPWHADVFDVLQVGDVITLR